MEDSLTDDQSHYEVSLTAGQAFLAFVLLLLSLGASFAFGLMIGRGQVDEALVAKKEPAVVVENPTPVKTPDEFVEKADKPEPAVKTPPPKPTVPHYAQILSTTEQKNAEALAAKLIDKGFTSAYVERGNTEKGPIFRVRVQFPSEQEARAAAPKLKEFSTEIWIARL